MCATDTPLGIALRNIRIHSTCFERILWLSILSDNRGPERRYPNGRKYIPKIVNRTRNTNRGERIGIIRAIHESAGRLFS